MKKILSVILSLIMMLSLLPMSVTASDFITDVDVNIPKPVAGDPLRWYSTVSIPGEDSNYKAYQDALWYDETEKRYMDQTENFQSGHIYTVEIWAEAKDGYEFDATATAYNLEATVNGKAAKVSKAFEYQTWAMAVVSYTFPEVTEHKEITHINVSDIIEPKIGRQSVARPHYLKYSEGVEGYDATWYENYQSTGASSVVPFKGVFAAEKTYTFEVVLEAKEGYAFARKSTGLPDVVVTFNGYLVGYDIRFDGAGRLVVLEEYDYLEAAKEKIMGIITYKIKEPVIGEKPSYVAENQRDDNLYVIDTQHSGTVNGIVWEEGIGDNSRVMSPDDTFKAGEYYHVTIRVKPAEGYLFETDRYDDFTLSGAINGETAICGGNDESAFVGLTFNKLEAPETRTVISEIEITSNHPDFCYVGGRNMTPRFEVTKGEPAAVSFEYWRQTKDDTVVNDFGIGEDATFDELTTTMIICIYFRGAAGKEYVLSKDVSVTVNGQKCNTGMFKSDEDYSEVYASIPGFIPVPEAKAPTFTVTFDSMGGSKVKSIKNLYYGDGIEAPEEPVREGYTFKTWYEDEECESVFIFKDETNKNGGYAEIHEDITLYAKWEKNAAEKEDKPSEKPSGSDTEKSVFSDVPKSEYYYAPVMWAAQEGITGGTSAATFSPDSICTRAQVVTFLHRMVGSPEPAAINMPFADVAENAFYFKPVKWAMGSKITGGTSATAFSPEENCTRAQVVTFLWRTAGQPEPSGKGNPFTDVKADSYYYDAVLWAVENGITGGTSATTFSPDSPCTRAQVVTFLYRFIN